MATLLVALLLFTSAPIPVHAQWVDIAQSIKEYGLDPLAWFAANYVIKKVASQTIAWINSGFKGNPGYLTDPKQFFLNVGDSAAANFLNETALNKLCAPFAVNIRLALVRHYLKADQNYSCSLGVLKNNYSQFINDFSQGGWQGWFELTQTDANNPYGAYVAAQNQLDLKVTEAQETKKQDISAGSGFLSFQRCDPDYVVTQAMIDELAQTEPELASHYRVGDCFEDHFENVTPGNVIQNQLNKVLGSGESRIEVADEISEIISALLNQLINKVLSGSGTGGLKGASEGGNNSFSTQLGNEKEPNPSSKGFTTNPPKCTWDQNTGQISCEQQTCTADPDTGETTCTGGGNSYSQASYGGNGNCNDVGGDGVGFTEAEWQAIIVGAECTPDVTSQGLQCVLAAVSPHGGSVEFDSAGNLRARVYLTVPSADLSCTKAVDISTATDCENCGGQWTWIKRF